MRYARHKRTGMVHRNDYPAHKRFRLSDTLEEISTVDTAHWLKDHPEKACRVCFDGGAIPREIRALIASLQRHPSAATPPPGAQKS